MAIDVGIECASQLDIRKSINPAMEMATADFFHSENIPNQAPESSIFDELLNLPACLGRIMLYQIGKNWT